jgi:nitric oxide reductase NorE protein
MAVELSEGPAVLTASVPRGRERARHLPGETGTWVFIFGDLTVFAVLFCTYLYYRGAAPDEFAAAQDQLSIGRGVLNTALLLLSSLFVVSAVRAVRAQDARFVRPLIGGAIACALGFALMKYVDYSHLVNHDLTPEGNNFWMYYFALTGLHFFHLLLGLGVLVALFVMAPKSPLSKRGLGLVEGGACFWHMVDMLWIVLFALLYLVSAPA